MASPGGYYIPPPRPRSIVGPVILIGVGALFLMRNFGYSLGFLQGFSRFWPLLLVAIGVVRLVEWMVARSSGRPAPCMGAGSVFLLVLLIIAGSSISAMNHAPGFFHMGPNDALDGGEEWMHLFGNEYTFDGELTQPLPAGNTVHVRCDRGNVTVNTWDQPQVRLSYHKRVFTSSQGEAENTDKATMPKLVTQGNSIEVQSYTESNGKKGVALDMVLYVPAKADVDINSTHGNVSVTQRTGEVHVVAQHGDLLLDQVTGNATVTVRHGSLHASNVTGNLTADGRLEDLVLDSIGGSAVVTADIFGDTHLSHLAKGAVVRTSRTELQVARMDGDLTMDSGDLHAENLQGPVSLSTKGKDINMRDIRGDLRINDDHGDISVESGSSATLGNLELTTHHGDVHLRLPSKASFSYSLNTRHGSISNGFGSAGVGSNGSAAISGTVGKGGLRVSVISDTGDIQLTKTEESMTPPAPPEVKPPAKPPTPPTSGKPGKKKVGDVDVM
jgi:DUF4097 and DUF4098 domain-containing protein YvlB